MDGTCCQIQCQCGGFVVRLTDDGIYYIVTERSTIIFRGICNQCGQGVRVEKDLASLLMLVPTKGVQ